MEGQAVRRRISTITAHFMPSDEFSASHVLPMNCSSTLNSVIRRYDSKLYFARQGSAFPSSFMRQGSIEEAIETENPSQNNANALPNDRSTKRCDSKLFFARQGSAHQATFMRQRCNEEVPQSEPNVPVKSSGPVTEYISHERTLFSRPSTEPRFTSQVPNQPALQDCNVFAADPPKFAVASRVVGQQNEQCFKKDIHSSPSNVVEWSPRMDVAESGRGYVITVEIPGVNVKDIRVEVDDKKLTVTGKRSMQYTKVSGCLNDSVSAYLRKEIVNGPYSVIWSLPGNVNKDCVSAEFLDGFLRVVIPKL